MALVFGCAQAKQDVNRYQRALTGSPPTFDLIYGFSQPLQCATRLIEDGDGSFYGVACAGGAAGDGAIFRRLPDGSIVTLYNFTGSDGSAPAGRLAKTADGTLYGSTCSGGANGLGTLFKYATGALTTLYNFSASDGQCPSDVIVASDGALYGTTEEGGSAGYGTLFKWDAGTGLTVLHAFDRTTGSYPYAGVMQGSDGALYGTTDQDGPNHDGTIFKWQAGVGFSTLYSFAGGDGSSPFRGGLIQGSDGALYGTTTAGGAAGYGTIFKWQAGVGLSTLHSFDFTSEGGYAFGGVIQGSDGALYGATDVGGTGSRNRLSLDFRCRPGDAARLLRHRRCRWCVSAVGRGAGNGRSALWNDELGRRGQRRAFQRQDRRHSLFSVTSISARRDKGVPNVVSPSGRVAEAPDGSFSLPVERRRDGRARLSRGGRVATVLHSFDWSVGSGPESGWCAEATAPTTALPFRAPWTGLALQLARRHGVFHAAHLRPSHDRLLPVWRCDPGQRWRLLRTTPYGGAKEAGTLFRSRRDH